MRRGTSGEAHDEQRSTAPRLVERGRCLHRVCPSASLLWPLSSLPPPSFLCARETVRRASFVRRIQNAADNCSHRSTTLQPHLHQRTTHTLQRGSRTRERARAGALEWEAPTVTESQQQQQPLPPIALDSNDGPPGSPALCWLHSAHRLGSFLVPCYAHYSHDQAVWRWRLHPGPCGPAPPPLSAAAAAASAPPPSPCPPSLRVAA